MKAIKDVHGDTLCCTKDITYVKGNRQWCGEPGIIRVKGRVRCAKHSRTIGKEK